MNRFQILKLPDDYIPKFALALTPEERARRVQFPLFEIASNPAIPLTTVRERRFNLIERVQDLANREIHFQTSWVCDPADSSAAFQSQANEIRDEIDREIFSAMENILPPNT